MHMTDDLPLVHQVISQLRACGHFLYFRMGGRISRKRILAILYQHPCLLQKKLQDMLHLQSGSLSEVIIKMEAEGLIEKVRSEIDGRQWEIRLTETGWLEAKRLKAEYEEQIMKMMACFSREELETLHELLETMFAHWNCVDLCLDLKEEELENE